MDAATITTAVSGSSSYAFSVAVSAITTADVAVDADAAATESADKFTDSYILSKLRVISGPQFLRFL